MKQALIKGLLVALLSMSSVHPFEYSQKTFLMPRAVGVNKAMEQTSWHSHIYNVRCNDNNLFTHFQLVPFFQKSLNRDETGRYFSIGNGKNSFLIGDPNPTVTTLPKADIDGAALVRISGAPIKRFEGDVTFNPEQEVWGVRFDLLQYFNTPIEGLFFKLSFPFVHVDNNMNMCIKDAKKLAFVTGTSEFTLNDFFAGKTAFVDPLKQILRDPLTHAKIDGRRTATGVADLDLVLGYCYHSGDKRHVRFNLLVTVPTGNRVRGEYLFEPIYGNGHHAAFGAGVDAGLQLWKGCQGALWTDVGVHYKYLFEGTEARTLGVKGMPFAQYFLASTTHSGVTRVPFFPAANILTRDLHVKPGNMFDAIAHFSFQSCHFVADIGYNLYWKDRESVWVKSWCDDTFGLLANGVSTAGAIASANFIDNKFLNKSQLDVDAVRTPAQLTHKLHGGLSYRGVFCCRYPASIAIGGSYEFAEDNSALEQYAFWLKFGFSI